MGKNLLTVKDLTVNVEEKVDSLNPLFEGLLPASLTRVRGRSGH